jgi:hypothetical protein
MRALNIQYVSNDADKENGAIIEECNEFIKSFYQMLEKYRKKIDEWKRLEQSALEAQADAPTDAAATSGRSTPSNITGRMTPTDMRSDAKLLHGKDARGEIVDAKRSGYMSTGPGAKGGRKRQVRKTRKLKRRPRKTTKRGGRGKRSMKRKYKSRKNTKRR